MENASKTQWISQALAEHQSNLIRYATWILGDVEHAREIVQETFLRLCRETPERVGDHLPQWLFTVCRNLAFDVRKKENRMTPLNADAGYKPRIEADLEQKEMVSQILRVVETLPKNQREVVYLKFQCDLSYQEISEITTLSVTTVGFLLHTAIKSIRKQMLTAPESVRRIQ
jgi:RNA polymerase sigma factor (sigma-70 family)